MNKAFIVDIGNSLIKIAYVDLESKSINSINAYGTKKVFSWKEKINFDLNQDVKASIYISSIAPKATQKFLDVIEQQRKIVFIKNEMFLSISKPEFDINEVGIDILASSYYALKHHNRSLLISCGTAIFASLNFDDKLQGVLIMPSITKAFSDLSEKCELINDFQILEFNKAFGFDTTTAITGGYFHMLNGTFKSIIDYAFENYQITNAIICGGNHHNVKKLQFDDNVKLDFSNPHVVISGIIYLINDLKI